MRKIIRISKSITISDFMWYYTRTPISHGCRFHEILHQTTISRGCIFHEILYQNPNISWLQISWDITPKPQYLMVAYFMRYYTRTLISNGWRFHEILHHHHNISWLQISWDNIPEPQYPFVIFPCFHLVFSNFVF